MKKLLTALLSAAVTLTTLAAVPASAIQLGDDMTFGHISEFKDFCDAHRGAVDAVAKGMYDLETDINIYDYGIGTSDARTLFTAVIRTHPELFYVSGRFSYSSRDNYVFAIKPHWGKLLYDDDGYYIGEEKYTDDQVLTMRSEFREKSQWYLNKIDDDMSDFDKALILHDELVLNSSYILTGETYDLMVNGKGKCYGYSEAYSYLLAQAGINSEIVESEAMSHQWNKVEIDGEYYHVDVTWDDVTPDSPGFADHTFFLLSDSKIESLSKPHYGYESDFPSRNTRFDDMDFRKINTEFCYDGGKVYVVDNNHPNKSDTAKKLLTYNAGTDSFSEVADFGDVYWSTGHGSVWKNMYMSLQHKDGFLYMNTPAAVYVFDTETDEMSLFAENTFDKRFFGLRVIEDKVYAVLADSPSETGTLQYVGDCLKREEPAPLTGDLNSDGAVNISDATILQRYLAEFIELDDGLLTLADVNLDGDVNVKDVTEIQRIAAEFV